MVGVPTETDGQRIPVPTTEDDARNLLALREVSVSVPSSHGYARRHAHAHSLSLSSSSSSARVSHERQRRRSNAYEYGLTPGSGSGQDDVAVPRAGYVYAPRTHARWSLPRSSVRSKSRSSRSGSMSQSGSECRSDDEHEDQDEAGVDVRVGLGDEIEGGRRTYGSRMRAWKMEDGVGEDRGGKDVRRVEQTWDGMEMEMEMD